MTTTVQDVVSRLRQPVSSLKELEELLAAPLASLNISVSGSTSTLRLAAPPSARQLATLQSTILAHVYPTWEEQTLLAHIYFLPPKSGENSKSRSGSRTLVLGALTVLTTPPLSRFAIRLLEKFVQENPLDTLWELAKDEGGEVPAWDGVLRAWMSVPGKVANALLGSGSGQKPDVPESLDFG
jgi:hypothetical protein